MEGKFKKKRICQQDSKIWQFCSACWFLISGLVVHCQATRHMLKHLTPVGPYWETKSTVEHSSCYGGLWWNNTSTWDYSCYVMICHHVYILFISVHIFLANLKSVFLPVISKIHVCLSTCTWHWDLDVRDVFCAWYWTNPYHAVSIFSVCAYFYMCISACLSVSVRVWNSGRVTLVFIYPLNAF